MAAINSEEYLTLVAEMENLKSNFTSLELENQRLLAKLEKQQQQEEFMWRVQQLDSTIVVLQQQRIEG